MKIKVRVFSGGACIEEQTFFDEAKANRWASYWQDNGYRVRFINVA